MTPLTTEDMADLDPEELERRLAQLDPETRREIDRILSAPEPLSFREFVDEVKPDYRWHPHCQVLARRLQQVAEGRLKRLMVFLPPRHSKSETVSRLFPAYYVYRHPHRKVALTSYNADIARDELSVWARDYYRAFGGRLDKATSAKKKWNTLAGGGVWSAGVGGPITGRGFHVGIIDDPLKNEEEAHSETVRTRQKRWYQSTWYPRQERGAAMIVVQTRWHQDDLSGWLLDEESGDHPEGWHVISLPAIAEESPPKVPDSCTVEPDDRQPGEALCPDRKDRDELLQTKERVGSYFWNALWQQRPSPEEGSILKRHWWQFHGFEMPEFDQLIQSWDMAFKGTEASDYVVGQVWGRIRPDKYLLDQVRERMEFTEALRAVRHLKSKWPKSGGIYVEDKANGPAVISALQSEISGLIPYSPEGRSKAARYRAVSPQVEAGNVYLPDPGEFPWVKGFIDECARAPTGAHDDQADAAAQALDVLDEAAETDSGFALV